MRRRTVTSNEPLQFYTGKDPMLYEIVVNSISAKNEISGYISTPKRRTLFRLPSNRDISSGRRSS